MMFCEAISTCPGGNLKDESDCRIVVCDNGRVWVDGEFDGVVSVRDRLREMTHESKAVGGVA